ncbi:MAG: hypothetical protein K6G27_15580 [Lachnospiraceae bacterium]|nr:hypothetical protein [Lachnospiraceae bacterium]
MDRGNSQMTQKQKNMHEKNLPLKEPKPIMVKKDEEKSKLDKFSPDILAKAIRKVLEEEG